jgi:hypothetical protein
MESTKKGSSKPKIYLYEVNMEGRSQGLGQMQYVRRGERGKETVEQTVDSPFAPGAKRKFTHSVDPETRKVLFDKSFFERMNIPLSQGIRSYGVTDPVTKKLITEVDFNEPGDKFFGKVKYALKYSGGTLREENVKDLMTLSFMRQDPRFWFASDDRPPSLAVVEFIVREVGTERPNDSGVNQVKGAAFYRKIFNLSMEKKLFIADLLGLLIPEDSEPKFVEDEIIKIIVSDPTRTVFGNERIADLVMNMDGMGDQEIGSMKIVNTARYANLFKEDEHDGIYYEGIDLGNSYREAATYILANPDIAVSIAEKLKQ